MLYLAIAVLSAAILGFEISLVRLWSIISWHHYVYMMISTAMLGFGASGSFIAIARPWLVERFGKVFVACAILFSITLLAAYMIGQQIPLNPWEIAWNLEQSFRLPLVYLVLMVPFFFGATCIGLSFAAFGTDIARIYGWDLVGSGAGGVVIIVALFVLPAEDSLRLLFALGFLAAGLACFDRRVATAKWLGAVLPLVGFVAAFALPTSWLQPELSSYKGLNLALNLPEARIVWQSSSPIGRMDVVESPAAPFRHAPGMSLANLIEPPEQLAVFTDGDSMTAITRFDGDTEAIAYLDYTTDALPYHLVGEPSVLVLGAGGGAPILLALHHDAARIDAVMLNGGLVQLLCDEYSSFAGDICTRDSVTVHVADIRAFADGTTSSYDLIALPVAEAYAAAANAGGMNEAFNYTIEAFETYLGLLSPGGLIAVTRPARVPPRDSLKLANTAIHALERGGVVDPASHILMIRGLSTATLVITRDPVTETMIERLKEFADERSFDPVWYLGMGVADANRFNQMDEPWFFLGVDALLGENAAAFVEDYKFALEPATDDRPWFSDFFRWRTLPELLALDRLGTVALVEWGYLVLAATLVQALVFGGVLILLPLLRLGTRGLRHGASLFLYFLLLGLAFFFVEIAFIQRLTLYLGHPILSVALVLTGFLVFAGAGAFLSARLAARVSRFGLATPVWIAVAGIVIALAWYLIAAGAVMDRLVDVPIQLRAAAVLLLLMPLGVTMGMPFPLGLAILARRAPEYVPWAWGINGCASVVSSSLATLLAMQLGFVAVMLIAAALYVLAALLMARVVRGLQAP